MSTTQEEKIEMLQKRLNEAKSKSEIEEIGRKKAERIKELRQQIKAIRGKKTGETVKAVKKNLARLIVRKSAAASKALASTKRKRTKHKGKKKKKSKPMRRRMVKRSRQKRNSFVSVREAFSLVP
jgi:hypothetical protein